MDLRVMKPANKIQSLIVSIIFFLVLAVSAHARESRSVFYPDWPEHSAAVQDLLAGMGDVEQVLASIDDSLAQVVPGKKVEEFRDLFILRGAADILSDAQDKETALLLFQHPDWCSRFLHLFGEGDQLDGAIYVIRTLHDFNPAEFEAKFEFCLAYALVWDNFAGHHWVAEPMEEETMLETYKGYLKYQKKMAIKPGKLPCELNVFIVGTRLSAAERAWIYKEYTARKVNGAALYKSVPWTLNNKVSISPAHGKGQDLPYVLETIRKIGGCCMEQAYFTENVCRLFGIPAVYTRGRGKTSDAGHAWAGVLEGKSKKDWKWNFDIGRYQSHSYFKGELIHPADRNRVVTDSEVKILGALLKDAGSVEKIEESNFYLDAARWAGKHLPERIGDGQIGKSRDDLLRELLVESLDAARYNTMTWEYLSTLAAEKKMSEKRASFWVDRAIKYTIDEYPDFTVDILGGFLGCFESRKKKLATLLKVYRMLEKPRPDLACELKVMEGDFRLAEGDLRAGLRCFIYPLVNFSENRHVLDAAVEKLGAIEEQVDDVQEVIDAYEMIFKTTRSEKGKDGIMAEVLATAAAKLVELYTQEGNAKKAKVYEKYLPKDNAKDNG